MKIMEISLAVAEEKQDKWYDEGILNPCSPHCWKKAGIFSDRYEETS